MLGTFVTRYMAAAPSSIPIIWLPLLHYACQSLPHVVCGTAHHGRFAYRYSFNDIVGISLVLVSRHGCFLVDFSFALWVRRGSY